MSYVYFTVFLYCFNSGANSGHKDERVTQLRLRILKQLFDSLKGPGRTVHTSMHVGLSRIRICANHNRVVIIRSDYSASRRNF